MTGLMIILKILLYFIFLVGLLFFERKIFEKNLKIVRSIKNALMLSSLEKKVEGLLLGILVFSEFRRIDFVPQYKFFTELFYKIVKATRSLGLEPSPHFSRLKKNLKKDFHFEKKMASEINGASFQCLMVALMTWVFLVMIIKMNLMEEKDWRFWPCILFCMQFLGLCVLRGGSGLYKRKIIGPFEESLSYLLNVQIHLEMEIPIKNIMLKFEAKSNFLQQIESRLERLIRSKQEMGTDIREDCSLCIEDLWDLWSEAFENLIKKLILLRFSCLVLFFLSPYFIFLFHFFSSHLTGDF